MEFNEQNLLAINELYKRFDLKNMDTYKRSEDIVESYYKSKITNKRKYSITIINEGDLYQFYIYAYDKLDVGMNYNKIYFESVREINECIYKICKEIKKLELKLELKIIFL
jgi:hypothetical protein